MILVKLPRDAATDLAKSWGLGVLIALLGLAYWLNTGARAVREKRTFVWPGSKIQTKEARDYLQIWRTASAWGTVSPASD